MDSHHVAPMALYSHPPDSLPMAMPETTQIAQTRRKIRKRARRACFSCHIRKVRCDVVVTGTACTNCKLDGKECVIRPSAYRWYVGLSPAPWIVLTRVGNRICKGSLSSNRINLSRHRVNQAASRRILSRLRYHRRTAANYQSHSALLPRLSMRTKAARSCLMQTLSRFLV